MGCGRYGGLGRRTTRRFEGAGPNMAASRGPKATGSGIIKGERAQKGSQGRTGSVPLVLERPAGDAVAVHVAIGVTMVEQGFPKIATRQAAWFKKPPVNCGVAAARWDRSRSDGCR